MLAPIPRAMVKSATLVKPGLRSITRRPNLRSPRSSRIIRSPHLVTVISQVGTGRGGKAFAGGPARQDDRGGRVEWRLTHAPHVIHPPSAASIAAGLASVVAGAIGIVIPLLPTTPFLLLAAVCFVRSSDRLHRWLTTNRVFGSYLRNYREHRSHACRREVVRHQRAVADDAVSVVAGRHLVVRVVHWSRRRRRHDPDRPDPDAGEPPRRSGCAPLSHEEAETRRVRSASQPCGLDARAGRAAVRGAAGHDARRLPTGVVRRLDPG